MTPDNPHLKYKIIPIGLLAPAFHANLQNVISLGIDLLMGFKPAMVTYHGVLGCYTEPWMYLFFNAIAIPLLFIITYSGYLLCKQPGENKKLAGSLLLFCIPLSILFTIIYGFLGNFPFSFVSNKEQLQNTAFPVFGNMYTYRWVVSILTHALKLFYLYLAYRVIFKYWTPQMRFNFFTFGIAASAAGMFLWYFIAGPALYN
ncbi:MAG: hypothetical protein V4658_05305 [Bacteroidota bacterium]